MEKKDGKRESQNKITCIKMFFISYEFKIISKLSLSKFIHLDRAAKCADRVSLHNIVKEAAQDVNFIYYIVINFEIDTTSVAVLY